MNDGLFTPCKMSKLNKYAQTDDGDWSRKSYVATAQSLKHMNEALMRRVKEGVDIISEQKKAIADLQAELLAMKSHFASAIEAEVKYLFPQKYGQEKSEPKTIGEPAEGARDVPTVPETEEKEEEVVYSEPAP